MLFLKRIFVVFVFIFGVVNVTFATHQRAAEITYKRIAGLTYEFTITMYTYTPSPADDVRTTLPIKWGDNSQSDIPRIIFTNLPDNYTLNIYRMNHTFPANGTYVISVEDPNRNYGVVNIPNSVNVPIYVESTLVINPFLGINNSVQLLNAPIDQGCVGRLFLHNASAYDPDGDSLSYRLVDCRGTDGLVIPGYTRPSASNSFNINALNGNITWDTPLLQGEYNIAFVIDEWRQGVKIGSVMRDMQILIGACSNNPPVISSISNACVIAGNLLTFNISATDPEGNQVRLTASGEPFKLGADSARLLPNPAIGTPTASTTFSWNATCSQVKRMPYSIIAKARDVHPEISLTALKTIQISVIAPPVQNLQTAAFGNGINLQWNKTACNNALGYRIYRKTGTSSFIPGPCESGVPASSGFIMIKQIVGSQVVSFRDDENTTGLTPGIDYCYIVTSYFSDGAESVANTASCARLKRDLPIFTHVSNDSIQLTAGRAYTAWSRPRELDTVQFPGPYFYDLVRYQGSSTQNPVTVFTATGLHDTIYVDNSINLNSSSTSYAYEVKLRNISNGVIGTSRKASSIFLEVIPSDKQLRLQWTAQVPWANSRFEIFRYQASSQKFVLIGTSTSNSYIDKPLENGRSYQYYVRSVGSYSSPDIIRPIINFSQLVVGIPVDNVPPCPPQIQIQTDCETIQNTIKIIATSDTCNKDIKKYRIYYTPSAKVEFSKIDSISVMSSTYTHRLITFVTGCYYVKAVDSTGNVSLASKIVCIDYDACPIFLLPNVFTPNGDSHNDLLIPLAAPGKNPRANIERIDLQVFNRWGNIVFKTNDPEVKWDGKHYQNGRDCAEGVYFYVCDVYFMGFDGIVQRRIQGSITILR